VVDALNPVLLKVVDPVLVIWEYPLPELVDLSTLYVVAPLTAFQLRFN
jgi:hypothetical protein